MSLPRKVTILGSTGSIGVSTLELFDRSGVDVEITALVAGRNAAKLAEQALRWRPQLAVVEDDRDPRYVLLWDQLRLSDHPCRLSLLELEWVQLFDGRPEFGFQFACHPPAHAFRARACASITFLGQRATPEAL